MYQTVIVLLFAPVVLFRQQVSNRSRLGMIPCLLSRVAHPSGIKLMSDSVDWSKNIFRFPPDGFREEQRAGLLWWSCKVKQVWNIKSILVFRFCLNLWSLKKKKNITGFFGVSFWLTSLAVSQIFAGIYAGNFVVNILNQTLSQTHRPFLDWRNSRKFLPFL